MDDFYVTLSSHTDNKYYENSLLNFTNKLASRISLKGNWEVGLSSISLTNYRLNLIESQEMHFYYYDIKQSITKWSIKIPRGSIVRIDHFYQHLNRLIDSFELGLRKKAGFSTIVLPRFKLDKKSEFIYFELGSFNSKPVFADIPELTCKILGFDRELVKAEATNTFKLIEEEISKDSTYKYKLTDANRYVWAKYRYNLLGKFHSMFVYCSIIKESYVAEKIVPLLRCFETPLDANYGGQIALNFDNPQYIPVRSKEIDNIEIKIKNEDGDPFPFEHGRVLVVLHFRRKYYKSN